MIKRIALLLSLALSALLPAKADYGGGGELMGFWAGGKGLVVLYRAACAGDTTDQQNYTFNSNTLTGLLDTASVLVVVGIFAEDSASNFNISSATIEGAAAGEIADEDGTGVVNSGFYTSTTEITGAASVDVTVSFSEAVTGASVCVWALENLESITPTATVVDDDTASGALILTLDPTTIGGYALGICGNSNTGNDATWAVLGKVQDLDFTPGWAVSNADAATTGASMSVTCDMTGTDDASGSAVAFR